MKGLPWVVGILIGLLLGVFAGHYGWKGAPDSTRAQAEHVTTRVSVDEAVERLRTSVLQDEVDKLKLDLAAKTQELARARADSAHAAAAPPKAAAHDVAATPEERAKRRDAAKKAFDDLAGKGLFAFMSPENKGMVAALLADLQGAGDSAYDLLQELLAGNDSTKRFLAISFLFDLDQDKALPIETKALHESTDDLVRRMASHSLATHKVERAVADLEQAMKEDKDWGVRANSAYGVAKMGHADGVAVLTDLYQDTSHPEQERVAVLGGLADVAAPSSARLFEGLLSSSKDDTTLLLSISAVEKMKDKEALGTLQAIIQGGGSSLVKDPAKKAYNTIYGQEMYR